MDIHKVNRVFMWFQVRPRYIALLHCSCYWYEFGDGICNMVHCVHNEPLSVVSAPVNGVHVLKTVIVGYRCNSGLLIDCGDGFTSAHPAGLTHSESVYIVRKQWTQVCLTTKKQDWALRCSIFVHLCTFVAKQACKIRHSRKWDRKGKKRNGNCYVLHFMRY